MTLREQMTDDLAVFLNPNEFGEEISIDGTHTTSVCDWLVQPDGEHLYGTTEAWGVNALQATIALAAGVIPTPESGDVLRINENTWFVRSASTTGGLLTLQLFRNVA